MSKAATPHLNNRFQSGSCIVCGQGTDTAIAFVGEAEWHIAGLTVLGLSEDEAYAVVLEQNGNSGLVDEGRSSMTVRVCRPCFAYSGITGVEPALVGSGAEVPGIEPL